MLGEKLDVSAVLFAVHRQRAKIDLDDEGMTLAARGKMMAANKATTKTITRFLRVASDYLAHRKGLPVLVGVGLIVLNLIVAFLPPWPFAVWLSDTDLLLHLGAIVGLLGVLLGDAL